MSNAPIDPEVEALYHAGFNACEYHADETYWESHDPNEARLLMESLTARLHAAAPAPPDDVREAWTLTQIEKALNQVFWVANISSVDDVLPPLRKELAALAEARPAEGSA